MSDDPRPAAIRHLALQRPVGNHGAEPGSQGGGIARGNNDPRAGLGNDRRHVAHRRGHNREPGGHGLQQGNWESFGPRAEDEGVEDPIPVRRVVAPPRKDDLVGDPEPIGLPLKRRSFGTLPDQHQT